MNQSFSFFHGLCVDKKMVFFMSRDFHERTFASPERKKVGERRDMSRMHALVCACLGMRLGVCLGVCKCRCSVSGWLCSKGQVCLSLCI